jgi:hypothetical protein
MEDPFHMEGAHSGVLEASGIWLEEVIVMDILA